MASRRKIIITICTHCDLTFYKTWIFSIRIRRECWGKGCWRAKRVTEAVVRRCEQWARAKWNDRGERGGGRQSCIVIVVIVSGEMVAATAAASFILANELQCVLWLCFKLQLEWLAVVPATALPPIPARPLSTANIYNRVTRSLVTLSQPHCRHNIDHQCAI